MKSCLLCLGVSSPLLSSPLLSSPLPVVYGKAPNLLDFRALPVGGVPLVIRPELVLPASQTSGCLPSDRWATHPHI